MSKSPEGSRPSTVRPLLSPQIDCCRLQLVTVTDGIAILDCRGLTKLLRSYGVRESRYYNRD